MSEWISVKDSLPVAGVPVLVTYLGCYDSQPYCDAIANIKYGDWCWWESYDSDNNEKIKVVITHWMPLPTPPEEE